MARADETFASNVQQCSVEAILTSQYINRMATSFAKNMEANHASNTPQNREAMITEPLRRELAVLRSKEVISDFDIIDRDKHNKRPEQIDIEINFEVAGRADRATITTTYGVESAPGNDG
jgi:hypothetical protein